MIFRMGNKVKRFYFEIWADAIEAMEKSNNNMTYKDKMFTLLLLFSVAQGFNLALVLLVLSEYIKSSFFLQIDIFSGQFLDGAIAGIITLFLPFGLLNYILIFRKKIIRKYTQNRKINTNGKAFLAYFLLSAGLFILIVVIGKWII